MALKIFKIGDAEILEGCRRGERKAQQRLYDRYAPVMYAICCRYLRDPMMAEDAMVTAFTHVLTRIDQFKGEGSLEGWIKTTVIRQSLTMLRKNKRLFAEDDIDEMDDHLQLAAQEGDPLEEEDLLRLIQTLPAGYRTVFNMYVIDGYSHKEIAERLQITENTSKSQLSRARALLQQYIINNHLHHAPNGKDATIR